MKFLKTLVTSALWRCEVRGSGCIWDMLKLFPALLSGLLGKRNAPPIASMERASICDKCPIFDKPRLACGKIGDSMEIGGRKEPVGCGCYMPIKVAIPEATCWIRDHGFYGGWPDHLQGLTQNTKGE